MEPVIIYKSDVHIKQIMTHADNLARTHLAQLSELFKNEGITLTDGHFLNFMEDRSIQQHREGNFEPGYVYQLLLGIAEADLERAKIKSERMKLELIKKATEYPVHKFAAVQRGIVDAIHRHEFELTDFSFSKDGKPMLSETGKERIEKKYTAILETEEEVTFWEIFTEFCKAYEKFGKHCMSHDRKEFIECVEIDHSLIEKKSDGTDFYSIMPNPKKWLSEKNNIHFNNL